MVRLTDEVKVARIVSTFENSMVEGIPLSKAAVRNKLPAMLLTLAIAKGLLQKNGVKTVLPAEEEFETKAREIVGLWAEAYGSGTEEESPSLIDEADFKKFLKEQEQMAAEYVDEQLTKAGGESYLQKIVKREEWIRLLPPFPPDSSMKMYDLALFFLERAHHMATGKDGKGVISDRILSDMWRVQQGSDAAAKDAIVDVIARFETKFREMNQSYENYFEAFRTKLAAVEDESARWKERALIAEGSLSVIRKSVERVS